MTIQHTLSGLLAVQLLLAGGLFAHHRHQQSQLSQQTTILAFDKASVDKIELADSGDKVVLSKGADGWTIPDYSKLPADGEKVDELLSDLSDLKGGWPVSTHADSHPQFEVAEKKFSKTVKLYAKDKPVAELYLGTSPGLRTTHVRNASSKDVYAATLSSAQISLADDQWLDRGLLKTGEPTEVRGKDYLLKKEGGSWNLEGVGAANKETVDQLLRALTGLRVDALAMTPPTGAPTATLEVNDGKPLTFSFWQKDDKVTVRRSDQEHAFTMTKLTYDQLMSYDKKALTPEKESATASPTPAATP